MHKTFGVKKIKIDVELSEKDFENINRLVKSGNLDLDDLIQTLHSRDQRLKQEIDTLLGKGKGFYD